MGDFNRGRSSGGFSRGGFGGGNRGGFGGRRGGFGGGRDRDRGEKEMFDAICAECGKACKIPFIPKTDKPVYCSSCFEKVEKPEQRGGFGGGRDFGSRDSAPRRSDNMSGEKLDLLISKMDKILELLKGNKVEEKISEKPAKIKEAKKEKKEEKEKPAKKAVKKSTKK